MGIRVNKITKKEIWNNFVISQCPWSLFQSFEWGKLQQKLGNPITRWGLFDKQQLVGIAQIIIIRAKRGKYIHIRHGPVFRKTNKRNLLQYWRELLKFIKDIAVKERVWFIRVSPMINDSPSNQKLLTNLGFKPAPIQAMDAEICWILDLEKSESELFSIMRKTTRNLVRQAQKKKIVVKQTSDICRFEKLYAFTYQRHKFVPHQGIKEEYEIFSESNQAMLLIGTHQKKDLAAALVLFFANQAIYHHGASIPTKIPVSYLLQWQAILEAKKRGIKYYNFWGIAPEDKPRHPWKGITMFKKGFGGEEKRFLHAHDLALSPNYYFTYIIESARKLLRGY